MLLLVLQKRSLSPFQAICHRKYFCKARLSLQSRFLSYFVGERSKKIAIKDDIGSHSYEKLLALGFSLKENLSSQFGDLNGKRIAILTPNNASHLVCHWSTWLSGAISVPLCNKHPKAELKYVLQDSETSVVLTTDDFKETAEELCKDVGIQHVSLPQSFMKEKQVLQDDFEGKSPDLDAAALIVYTSGTTGRPKGVLYKHKSIKAQIDKMIKSWKWKSDDVLLHVLPLHHVHGLVNKLFCPISVGATVIMESEFDAQIVWKYLLGENVPKVTVFMAVPTIYSKLIELFDKNILPVEEAKEKCKKIRLMVSGSAALPTPVFKRWEEITGHVLLERYGMTEFGMGLTNPYNGERIPGAVGFPFPGVSAKIVGSKEDGTADYNSHVVNASHNELSIAPGGEGREGELLIRSDSMFEGYWKKAEATAESFADGWFITGDTAVFDQGVFRILGRTSVDVIKSGGYKISALDVERHLLEHPSIDEVAVLGVKDPVWGQRIVALVTSKSRNDDVRGDALTEWCRDRIPRYSIPSEFRILAEIPRNVMGKVNKKELLRKLFS